MLHLDIDKPLLNSILLAVETVSIFFSPVIIISLVQRVKIVQRGPFSYNKYNFYIFILKEG